jgi:hypothetical protein
MSKYTTELRFYIESGNEVFDFDYPIFDESYRSVLEQKIMDTYYFREIGFETVGRFKHYLKAKLNTIMPYYNKLYETDNLITVDNYNINLDNTITKTNEVTQTSSGSSTATGTNKGTDTFSDTPQSRLYNRDYATNMTETDSSTDQTATSDGNMTTLEEYKEHLLGNGSMRYNADILMEWRKSFLNIDKQILDELNDLFMSIY